MRRSFVWCIDKLLLLASWWRSRRDTIGGLQAKLDTLRMLHQAEVESLQATIRVRDETIQQLTEVIERDRERVRAEIAIAAARRELAVHQSMQG